MRSNRVKHSIVFCLLFIFTFMTAANVNCIKAYAAEQTYTYNTRHDPHLFFSGGRYKKVCETYGSPFPVQLASVISEGKGIKSANLCVYLYTDRTKTFIISSPCCSSSLRKSIPERGWDYHNIDVSSLLREQVRYNDRDFNLSLDGCKVGCNDNEFDGHDYRSYSPQLSLTYTDRPKLEFIEQPFNQKYTNKVPIKVTGKSPDRAKLRIATEYHTASESAWHPAATSPYFSSETYTHNWDISKIKFPEKNLTMRIRIEDEYGGYTDWQYKQFQVASPPEINLTTVDNQILSNNSGLNIKGTVKDADVNDVLTVRYTLDGIATNKVVTTLSANGSWQSFNKNVTIAGSIPEGTKTLRVWVQDDKGNKSSEITRVVKVDNKGPKAFNPVSSNITTGSMKATATTSDNVAGLDTNTGYRFYLNNTLARDWGANSFTYSGLKPNTQYSLKVEARDKVNNTTMSGVLKKYTLAQAPASLKFTKTAETNASLSWSANGNPTGTKYILERKEGTGAYKAIASNLTGTSYGDSGLTPGKTYMYRIEAQNGNGVTTSYSNETTLVAVPDKPATPTLTNNDVDKLNITWTKTTEATGYILYKGSTPIYTGSGLTYTDTGLATNTKYTYHLIATNNRGKGTAGNSASKYTLAKVPTDINISDIKETSLKLSWGSNGNPADTKYILERKEGTGPYTAIAFDLTTTSYSDSGLTPGKTYTYRVKAQNGNGVNTSYSNENKLIAVPNKPAVPTIINNGVDKLNIIWTKTTGATGYILYRGSTAVYTGSGLTYTDTGLTINKQYTYHLIATNSRGKSIVGDNASKYTLSQTPANINITNITETSADLAWGSNGNPASTKYIMERKEGTGIYTAIASDLTETSYKDDALIPGKTYIYRVKAQNGNGIDTAYSEESTLVAIPDKPTAPTVTAKGVDRLNITWAVVEGATEYTLYRGDKAIYTGSELTYTDESLAPSTQYTYNLTASNNSGISKVSESISKYTLAKVPIDITFSNITETSVKLSWKANGNPVGTKYILERKEGSETYKAIASELTEVSYKDDTLTPGKTYTYRVKAQNGDRVDTAYSEESTLVAIPDKPVAPTVTNNDIDKLNITWVVVEGATEYTLYRGDTNVYTGPELTFTDTSLALNTQYTYTLTATNSSGTSKASESTSKYTLAKVPIKITFSDITETSASLSWKANGNPEGTKYIMERKEGTETYKAIASDLTETSYSDSGLTPGKTYTYRVKAQNGDGVDTIYSEERILVAVPDKPTAPTMTVKGVDKLTITWAAVEGATEYTLYQGDTAIYTGPELTFMDTGLAANTQYTYHLTAANSSGKSTAGDKASKYTLAKIPTDINISDITETSASLSWGANGTPAGTKYIMERKEGTGSYKTIASDLTETSYSDSDLTSGKTYTYRVKAQNGDGIDTAYSKESTIVAVPDKPAVPTVSANSVDTLAITWTAVEGATEYILYRGDTAIYTGPELTYTDTGLVPNTQYTYYLVAANSSGKSTAGNSASKFTLAKKPVSLIKTASTADSITFKLENDSANGVVPENKIIVKEKPTGNTVTESSYSKETTVLIDGLTEGTEYEIWIRTLNEEGEETIVAEEGSYIASIRTNNIPEIIVNPNIQYISDVEGFNKVTVTGKVYDLDGDMVTITVEINEKSKDAVIKAPQTEPADNNWLIEFDLDELGLVDGEYNSEDVKITVTDGKNSNNREYPKDSKIIVDREEPVVKSGGFILNEGSPLLLGKDAITKGPRTSFRVEVEPSLSGPWKIELSNFPDFSQAVTYDFPKGELFIEHDKETGFATASDAQVGRKKTVYLRAYNRAGKYTEASKKVIKNALPEVKNLTLEPKLAGAYPQIRWTYKDEDKDLQKAYEIKVTAVSTGADKTYTLEGDATTFTYDPKKYTTLDDGNYRITVRVQDDLNTWGTWADPLDFNMNIKTDGIVTIDPSENPDLDKVYGVDGCTFQWEIKKPCEVKVIIENAEQTAVRTINEGKKDASKYSTYWDTKDDDGKIVPLGEYTAYLELYDGVNTWREELGKINIDTTPPKIINTDIKEITNEEITIDLKIDDDSSTTGKVIVTDSEGDIIVNEDITEETYKKIITPDKDGEYTIRIEVTDEVGNKTALEKTIIYETQAPEIYVNYTPETSSNATEITITVIDQHLTKILVNKEEVTFTAIEANKYAAKATITLRDGANDITITALDKAGNSAEKSIFITYNPPKNNQGTISNPSEFEKKVDQVVEEINSDKLDNVNTVVDEVLNSNLNTEDKKKLTGKIVDTLISDEKEAKLVQAYDIQEEILTIDINDPQGYLMMMEIKKKLLKNGYLNYVKVKTAKGEVVVLEKGREKYAPINDAATLLGIDTSKIRAVDSTFVFNTDQGTVIVNPDGSVIGHPEIKKLQVITDYGRIYVLVSDLEKIFESDIKLTEIEDKHNSNEHWAYPYAQEIIDLYGIEVNVFGLDNEAPVELQQKLYDLMGLKVQARKSMTRFWLFYYLTETLNISADGDPDKILSKYGDYCDTCRKMNSTLLKAEKADLLNGRTWFDGTLQITPKAPVTTGELCALTVKYLNLK